MGKNIVSWHSQRFIPSRNRFVFATSALLGSGLAATIGGLALAGAGTAAAYGMSGGGKSSAIPGLPSAPTADSVAGSATTAAEKARIRKKTKTILTSPLTGGEYYGSAAPTLLGAGDTTKKQVLG